MTLSQAPPCIGTNCKRAGPAATAPARQLHAHVRKRAHRNATAQGTNYARGSAPRSAHPFAPAALSPAAGDSGGAPRLHRCWRSRPFTISAQFLHGHWFPLTNAMRISCKARRHAGQGSLPDSKPGFVSFMRLLAGCTLHPPWTHDTGSGAITPHGQLPWAGALPTPPRPALGVGRAISSRR